VELFEVLASGAAGFLKLGFLDFDGSGDELLSGEMLGESFPRLLAIMSDYRNHANKNNFGVGAGKDEKPSKCLCRVGFEPMNYDFFRGLPQYSRL
jgi:hypothetical protein